MIKPKNLQRAILAGCLFIPVLLLVACTKNNPDPIIEVELEKDQSFFPENTLPALDELHHRTVNYFWDTGVNGGSDSNSGMAGEGADRKNALAAGGTGFAVMAIISGVDRGWIDRNEAALRMQTLVRFLGKADRFKGAWAHWTSPTGKALPWGSRTGGDLLETSLLMQGLIMVREYFDGADAIETEVRDSINSFYSAIQFSSFTKGTQSLYWSWYPPQNGAGEVYELPIGGYNEALVAYILAIGAPKNAIPGSFYQTGWYRNGSIVSAKNNFGYETPVGNPYNMPMFLSHYSMLSLNPQEMQDTHMFFWDYSVKHTMINRHYCVHQSSGMGYSESIWGLTASYSVDGYSAHSPGNDLGVISPTAAISSMPFTPYYSMQVLFGLKDKYPEMYNDYGFYDAFSPSTGWQSKRFLAIDQGPMPAMIENYRSGLLWNLFMNAPEIKKGLLAAGIHEPELSTGFGYSVADVTNDCVDLMMHPDQGDYQIKFFLEEGQQVEFILQDQLGKTPIILAEEQNYPAGENELHFSWQEGMYTGDFMRLIMNTTVGYNYMKVILH
ncbi:MAG: glucoamylase family protein [Prolixibacteraceae bacterium]